MRILYYNWVDYLDPERRGGGVTVYQQNLVNAMADQDDVDVWFLSSGISFDLLGTKPRWEKIRHGPRREGDNRYEIVNSGVLSPSHFSFGNPAQIRHPETAAVFFDFLETHGPFDVIHFNNLEGVPAEVLELKSRWPDTRILLSLHNYYPFCPQVNLWWQEQAHCADFRNGDACRGCLVQKPDERSVRLAGAVAYNLKKMGWGPGTQAFDRGFSTCVRCARRIVKYYGKYRRSRLPSDDTVPEVQYAEKVKLIQFNPTGQVPLNNMPAAEFSERRQRFLDLINQNCDNVLGVSQRVTDIAGSFGVKSEILQTLYIGTQQYGKFIETEPGSSLVGKDNLLTLGYLGYMRKDKGYFFLMEALQALPDDLAQRIRLVVAAPWVAGEATEHLRELSGHLRDVIYVDGYKHDQLDTLLEPVTLGVVPVMWEDNLPQVAIEMHVRHIPLLTSDRGGAQELGNFAGLVFRAGNVASFTDRIRAALEARINLDAYWEQARIPVNMEQHVAALLDIYRGLDHPQAGVSTETETCGAL